MTREQAKVCLQAISNIPLSQIDEVLNDPGIAKKVAEQWKIAVLDSTIFSRSNKAWKIYLALVALSDIDSIAIPDEIDEEKLMETDVAPEWLVPAESNFITEV